MVCEIFDHINFNVINCWLNVISRLNAEFSLNLQYYSSAFEVLFQDWDRTITAISNEVTYISFNKKYVIFRKHIDVKLKEFFH